ncbi:MAG: hypothetical protein HON90_11945 [Halobacteriovoraceae bacterium]|jgi:hypothetical protein|nr:hypothetical protein [Halobacteriovoraceae bacterium]
MKKVLFLTLAVLISMTSFAREVFDANSMIKDLPLGTTIRLNRNIVVRKGQYFITRNQCRLFVNESVAREGAMLTPHLELDILPEVISVKRRTNSGGFCQTYINIRGADSITSIQCSCGTFKELQKNLEGLELTPPKANIRKL